MDPDLYQRAKYNATRISAEIRACDTDVSAFRLSPSELKTWLNIEDRLKQASSPLANVATVKAAKDERQKFLDNLR